MSKNKICIVYGCSNKCEGRMCDSCYEKVVNAREEAYNEVQRYLKERERKDDHELE